VETPSPSQLRVLLALVAVSLTAVIAAVVALVRSGRSVQFPIVGGGESPVARSRDDHVSIR
jgi:hypothetical protein